MGPKAVEGREHIRAKHACVCTRSERKQTTSLTHSSRACSQFTGHPPCTRWRSRSHRRTPCRHRTAPSSTCRGSWCDPHTRTVGLRGPEDTAEGCLKAPCVVMQTCQVRLPQREDSLWETLRMLKTPPSGSGRMAWPPVSTADASPPPVAHVVGGRQHCLSSQISLMQRTPVLLSSKM